MPTSFGVKLEAKFKSTGQLCLGIDPHASILESWGLTDSIAGLDAFSKSVINACVGRVGIIKPQVAFFERFGSRGFKVLEEISELARSADLLVVMDAKRGDIGSTMQGYFEAWLGKSAPFFADALTVSPYLGIDSLDDFFAQAQELGKGCFVLAATSNPEGAILQGAKLQDGESASATVARSVWQKLNAINAVTYGPKGDLGDFGAVIGATLNLARLGLADITGADAVFQTPILAPGFGAQGAELVSARDIFGSAANRVLYSVSRSVLESGSNGIARAIDTANKQLKLGLG